MDMKINALQRENREALTGKNFEKVGCIEGISLKISGRSDAKKKIITPENNPGNEKEKSFVDIFASKRLAVYQIAVEELISKCDSLIYEIGLAEKKYSSVAMPDMPDEEYLHRRLRGEEGLTESQVVARRSKAYNADKKAAEAKLSQLATEVDSKRSELISTFSSLQEALLSTELVFKKFANKSVLRSSIYRRAAQKYNPSLKIDELKIEDFHNPFNEYRNHMKKIEKYLEKMSDSEEREEDYENEEK